MNDRLYNTYHDMSSPKIIPRKNVVTPKLSVDHFDTFSEFHIKSNISNKK